MNQPQSKKRFIWIGISLLTVGLVVSMIFNLLWILFPYQSYLQSTEQIYIMEAGILRNNLEFAEGEERTISYKFDCPDYAVLIETYQIDQIAGTGSEFDRTLRLMHEFAPRLTHNSYYDNHIEMNALDLLAYSLNNKKHGINCRGKAQILNELCLALGIYARKVWIMPNSGYDNDCHVVNEIWDSQRSKWIMLDITNDEYWVDENGTPLSILEIRELGATRTFCTPVQVGDRLDDLAKLQRNHYSDFLYIMKNMTYMEYCMEYGVGESDDLYLLFPKNLATAYEFILSECAVVCPPDGSGNTK